MPQAVESVTSTLEQLSEHVQSLERRVAALERQRAPQSGQEPALAIPPQEAKALATWPVLPAMGGATGAISVLGKSVLGIAGAYLLRALSESGTVPQLFVLFVAILYACLWMIWAARVHRTSEFASATYAVTSAAILSPLLWESTVRFQALSVASASLWLVVFVVLAIALAWRSELQMIPGIATLSSVATAMALIIETRDLLPVTAAILAMAFSMEMAACAGHRHTARVIPAIAASFSVWLLAYIMTGSAGVPEGYHAIAPWMISAVAMILMAVYGGSVAVRHFARRNRISFLDLIQSFLAFAAGSYAVLRSGSGRYAAGLGIAFLLLAAVCYWAALVHFVEEGFSRNRRIFSTWALGLLLAGTLLCLPQSWRASFLCLAATGAAFIYARTGKLSIGMHSSVLLAVAAVESHLAEYVASALAGAVPSASNWRLWVVGLSAALCYAIGARHSEENSKRRLLWILPALLLGFAVSGIIISAVVSIGGQMIESRAASLSVVRTITNCLLALTFGFFGARLKRVELTWAAYAAVGFGTLKLAFEDLRYGNAASLVVSLLFYGLVLILLPRISGRATEN